mgnify:CR=1 FL=1
MEKMKIHLKDVMAVKELVDLVSLLPGHADLVDGDAVVDAKSIMSIFALDLSREFELEIDGEISPEFREKIAPFLV